MLNLRETARQMQEAMDDFGGMMSDFGEMMNEMMGDIVVVARRPRKPADSKAQPEKWPSAAKPNMAKAQATQTKSMQAKPDSQLEVKAKVESENKTPEPKVTLDKQVKTEAKQLEPDKRPGTETRQPQSPKTEAPKAKRKLKALGWTDDQTPLEMEELCKKAENLNLHLRFWQDAESGEIVAELSTFKYTMLGKIYKDHLCGNVLGSAFRADDELTIEANDRLITGYFNYRYARLYNLLLSLFVGMADMALDGAVQEFNDDYMQCQDDITRTRACAGFLAKITKLLDPKEEADDNDADLTASERLAREVIAKVMSAELPRGMYIGLEGESKITKMPEILAFNSLAPLIAEREGTLFTIMIDDEDWIVIKAPADGVKLAQDMKYSEKYWNALAERFPKELESRLRLVVLDATETHGEEVFLGGKFSPVAVLQARHLLGGMKHEDLGLSLENQLFYKLCRGIFDYMGMIEEVEVNNDIAKGMRSALTGKEEIYRFAGKMTKLALVRDLKSELLARSALDVHCTVNMLAMLFRYYGISLSLQEDDSAYVCTIGMRLWWGNAVTTQQQLECTTAEELYEELFAILLELVVM